MPINLETINMFYGLNLRPFEVKKFLKDEIKKENYENPRNLEERAVSLVGRPLYEAFIKGYTQKQWQKDPKELPVAIINRLPFRGNYNESYFFDCWQGIPQEGYAKIFHKMLQHNNIDLQLEMDFFDIKSEIPASCNVIYCGAIDQFYNYRFGRLQWRSLEFERDVIPVEDFQGTSVMNFTDLDVPYTRIHEPRHLHEERNYTKEKTLIFREFPKADTGNAPYYPIADEDNMQIFHKYETLAQKENNVIFGGRLADYKYYDMHHVIERALFIFQEMQRSGIFKKPCAL